MVQTTPLYEAHRAAGGRMVEFAGWTLPIHYGSQLEEHHTVRRAAGVFDVSHMTVVDIEGSDAGRWLRRLLANDVDRLDEPGQAMYGCMLNEDGGVLDDLITYFMDDGFYRLVVNAATRENDLEWMRRQSGKDEINIREREDLAMLAVQGPIAPERVNELFNAPSVAVLKPFRSLMHGDCFIARTGYTGEDGVEIIVPAELAPDVWDGLLEAGVRPCGLGARDSLRLEAGLNLYGQDMDTTTTPLESNLAWTVAFEPDDRDFIGRRALESQRQAGVKRKLTGLVIEGRGIPRGGARVITGAGNGEVTSGAFGPTVKQPVALARMPAEADGKVQVEHRGKRLPARVVRPPFVRKGQVRPGIIEE